MRIGIIGLLVGSAAAFVAGFPQPLLSQQQESHPDQRLIVRESGRLNRMTLADARAGFGAAAGIASQLSSIGSLSGMPPEAAFGGIRDVEVDQAGRIYIVDKQPREVMVFDSRGRFLQKVGRLGEGPGEFSRGATSVASDTRGRLYVGDAGRRINVFAPRGDTLAFLRMLPVGVTPYDMCVFGDTLIMHARNPAYPGVIAVADSNGKILRTFGEVYRTTNLLIKEEMTRGSIACDRSRGLIVFASNVNVNDVRGYGVDGTLRWVSTISDYRSFRIAVGQSDPSDLTSTFPADGYNRIDGLAVLPSGDVLVSVALTSRAARAAEKDHLSLISLVLDGATGQLKGSYRDGIPIRAARSGVVLSAADLPFPRIGIWARR
jgi:hypothetical protein